MTPASRPQTVTVRSGDVVRLRQVRPGDAPALARAYANLGEQSRYRRFFTVMPELPEQTLREATEIDHEDHEALVALPLLSREIVGGCRYVRVQDRPDTAEVAVAVIDAWQGRGVGSALLRRLSERALESGIEYFTATVLAENRTVLAMLSRFGQVETETQGTLVSARVEIAEPQQTPQELRALLAAAARGQLVAVPAPLRPLLRATEEFAHRVRLPVTALLNALRPQPPARDPSTQAAEEAGPEPTADPGD